MTMQYLFSKWRRRSLEVVVGSQKYLGYLSFKIDKIVIKLATCVCEMPGDNCALFGCGSCRNTRRIGIWKRSAPRNDEYKQSPSTNC